MSKLKKVKNILFRLNLVGQGVVNYDSNDQKRILKRMKGMEHVEGGYYNNMSFAKKNFYRDGDGNVTAKLKISSDCLRHEVFSRDVFAQTPNITHDASVLCSFIASPLSLIRGYMLLEGPQSFKRKSALSITDAEQTNDALSYLETCARSGEKTEKANENSQGDTTFFKKETVGNMTYEAVGAIDLKQLQFVSADSLFDRYAFNPDDFETYKNFLKLRLPSFNSDLGYYTMNGSVVDLAEYGVKLSSEDVQALVNDILRRLNNLTIQKTTAFARVAKMEYKLVYDPFVDTFDNQSGWSTLEAKPISFEPEDFYTEHDAKAAEERRATMKANRATFMLTRETKKAEEKTAKAEAKKNKKAATEA